MDNFTDQELSELLTFVADELDEVGDAMSPTPSQTNLGGTNA